MAKNLVIVESPAKAKTIEKYLGKDFSVKSSMGHIRDIPSKGMNIDLENNFEPHYEITASKKKTVAELRKAAKAADEIWLASDEDREGEAIAWHLCEALKIDPKTTKRIVFHEITTSAITEAISKPRTVNVDLVDAQQARRVIDRIVGYELSPVLWKKIRRGLSAGRVQSVAVRLVVEKERDIQNHTASSDYKLTATLTSKGEQFSAEAKDRLDSPESAKVFLESVSGSEWAISDVEKKPGKKNPNAPFTTSTLQQTASNLIGYSPKRTMQLAQRLYEAGKITYMRTDSLNLSGQAITQATEVIKQKYGENYVTVRNFKSKSKGAQEAHEAIRPTDLSLERAGEDEAQAKLYSLIRARTLASQMSPASVEKTVITAIAKNAEQTPFTATGEIVTFPGFLAVMPKRQDDTFLPDVASGDKADLVELRASETPSRAPARYSEASLIKKLEELGIGRPSTYAPTVSTIQDRGYVLKGEDEGEEVSLRELILSDSTISEESIVKKAGSNKGRLVPTDAAGIVTDFLQKHFPNIVDFDFTANLEQELDDIADGDKNWKDVVAKFYGPFHEVVEQSEDIKRTEAAQQRKVGDDPKTGKPIFARFARYGAVVVRGDSSNEEEKVEFAPIPKGATIDTVTLEQALKAFELPRVVGETPSGDQITANIGRFGPYVKFQNTYVSIKQLDPYTITEAEANELIAAKIQADKERVIHDWGDLKVLNGRFGPFVTDGKKNGKIPKETDPKSLTQESAQKLLDDAPAKSSQRKPRKKRPAAKKKAKK